MINNGTIFLVTMADAGRCVQYSTEEESPGLVSQCMADSMT